MTRWILFLGALGFILPCAPSATSAKKKKYTRQERDLSKAPPARLNDRRLRRVYKQLARQYKFIYGHAAHDGYIMPRELRELGFHRRMMRRIRDIDENHTRVRKALRKLRRKQRRRRRLRRWRRKRPRLTAEEQQKRTKLLAEQDRVEKMIRRFACRHDKRYKKRHPKHCPKIKI